MVGLRYWPIVVWPPNDKILNFLQWLQVNLDSMLVSTADEEKASTRQGQGVAARLKKQVQPTVIVDMREFRSHVPRELYAQGLRVLPATLGVADYVLSRDMAVERKALDDLRQSMVHGRLFTQAEHLCKCYPSALLLIELDSWNCLFPAESIAQMEKSTTFRYLQLMIFMLHFPKLHWVWSPSPNYTAKFFRKLKQNRFEPDVDSALKADRSLDAENSKGLNQRAVDVLR